MKRRQAYRAAEPFDVFEQIECSGVGVNHFSAEECSRITADRWRDHGLPLMVDWRAEWQGDYPAHRDSPPWPFLVYGAPDGWDGAAGDRYRLLVAAVDRYEDRQAAGMLEDAVEYLAVLREALAGLEAARA